MSKDIQYILGLDLGTNSIGWALVEVDHVHHIVRIMMLGSRIIPMAPSEISKFENGGHMDSAASVRREAKQVRRMNERFILRRDRLNYVLNLYSMLPEHYRLEIDFETHDGLHSGKFKQGKEPKIAYKLNADKHKDDQRDKYNFIFNDRYQEMKEELLRLNPMLNKTPIPKDWTLYYLRKKALTEEISLEELSWVLHSFNKKRGYEKVEGTEEQRIDSEIRTCSVTNISRIDENTSIIELTDEDTPSWHFSYQEVSSHQLSTIGRFKQVEVTNAYNEDGELINAKTKFIIKDIVTLTAVDIKQEKKNKVFFDNGWEWETKKNIIADTPITFICSEEYKYDGSLKNRSLALVETKDKKVNWAYIKLDTETKIAQYNRDHGTKGVASFIYDNLLSHNQDRLHTKIKGNLVESVDRRYYREEVIAILTKQASYHDGFKEHYREAVEKLYPHNESHRNLLMQQSFTQFVADDILLYQRELKSKKSDIDDCKFEVYKYKKDGKEVVRPVKAAHTSNPYFQEFRIWKFINQLRILELPNDKHASPLDVTEHYLTNDFDARAALFDEFQKHKTIKSSVLRKPFLHLPNNGIGFTWNYELDHEERGNETRYDFICRLRKINGFDWEKFLDATHLDNGKTVSNEYMLWHFFYSVKRKSQRTQGLPKLVKRLLRYADMSITFRDEIVTQLSTFGSYPNHYGAYSEKALMKLLPLMRCGKYWNANEVTEITGVENDVECQGLMENGSIEHLSAVDIVYKDKLLALNQERWQTPQDILKYLKKEFKHNSLKNPVVEKVVREMLYVVHDIWKYNLDANDDFKFDEIHIELGRELQRSPKQKSHDIETIRANQRANRRAELILKELKLESLSPFLREKYRIYEDCIMSSIQFDKKETLYEYKDEQGEIFCISKKEIEDIQKEIAVSAKDIKKYRLWLDQRFSSPYTGKVISLTNLFDRTKYEREHTFPQERITLNSLKNLFMCEVEINKAKGARTGMEFIKEFGGKTIKGHRIFTETEYREWVNRNVQDSQRREILLSEKIPTLFTNNQLNNTRYISRLATSLLGRIVRTETERSAMAAGIVPVNGSVTASLRHDWHMSEVWNELIAPRFMRMNQEIEKLTGIPSSLFGEKREINGHNVFIPNVPDQYRDSFEKKRIDHRHHALDALIVALTLRSHIQYINNVSGEKNSREAICARKALKAKYTFAKQKENNKETYFLPPMQYKQDGVIIPYTYAYSCQDGRIIASPLFDKVVLSALKDTLVTFKQNNRLISPRQNLYQHWDKEEGKIITTKEKGLQEERKWCLRQSLSPSETIYGQRVIDGKTYLQTKWSHSLDTFASLNPHKVEDIIDHIPDKAIRDILHKYFIHCKRNPAAAFTPEGISYMNKHIIDFTPNGKNHMPIYKVSILQRSDKGHPLSPNGGVKSRQFTKDNSNVLCYFYSDKTVVRTLDMVIRGELMPSGYAFTLCPNELVYVPTEEEAEIVAEVTDRNEMNLTEINQHSIDLNRVYKVVSFDPSSHNALLYLIPAYMAQMLISDQHGFDDNKHLVNSKCEVVSIQGELSLTSYKPKSPREFNSSRIIRDFCWKVVLNRMGQIDHFVTRSGIVIKR